MGKVKNKIDFDLTKDQKNVLNEINSDLASQSKMFRILQGDVGSGKTIVALISALNVIESGYQVALMAPTEILAMQHYKLAKNLFSKKINLEINLETRICKLQAEEIISTTTKPIINPITGAEHRAKIHLPNGIEFHEAEMGSGSTKAKAAFKTDLNESYVQIAILNLTPQGIPS